MEYKTFNDLEFKAHPNFPRNAKQASIFFPNDYGASVVIGSMLYSNGVDTYEIACLHKDDKNPMGWTLVYPENTSFEYDVRGYCTKEEITKLMKEIQDYGKI